jgi:hypothetical protein
MKLVRGEWWTRASGRTGARGSYTARAFYGTHEITVTDRAGHTTRSRVSFPAGSKAKTIAVTLPAR